MNLVVDIGNTFVKYAVFNKDEIVYDTNSKSNDFVRTIKTLFKEHSSVTHAIISSVGGLEKRDFDILSLFCNVHVLTHKSKVPFKNSYATPQTLGLDRIALVTAAFYHNPHENNLIIDAGTCITYDMINDFDEYLGGAISPGIQMRYKALNQQTAKLPLLEKEEPLDFIGNCTKNSIHSGVINGVYHEIYGVIDQYNSRFKDLTVILTGGDALFLSERLKNTIFADSKFLLKGLNYLLEYNKH
ncbi:type III pantothenate kinase [Maribacter sp. CXY002]|uniref:type III pantothenate kinase n=1 Tax=Maribacter luteocoastalis TaxID=3407671 RepID=UPI003B67AD39